MKTNQDLARYNGLQIIFEASSDLIKDLQTPASINNRIKSYANDYLEAHNENNKELCRLNEGLYEVALEKARELKMDISNFPETLEELTQ
jgi:hypothetical protein